MLQHLIAPQPSEQGGTNERHEMNTEDEEFTRIEQEIKRNGRPPMDPAKKKKMAAVSLSIEQKEKLRHLGGSVWLQKQIDKAKLP